MIKSTIFRCTNRVKCLKRQLTKSFFCCAGEEEGCVVNKRDESDSKSGKSVGSGSGSSTGGDHGGSLTSTSSKSGGKLSRKDSFNNWSSDEETNLMMNKMRAFFRNMVSGNGSDKAADDDAQPRVKPPQLVVFETELTRLMKSVPGINDQQVANCISLFNPSTQS